MSLMTHLAVPRSLPQDWKPLGSHFDGPPQTAGRLLVWPPEQAVASRFRPSQLLGDSRSRPRGPRGLRRNGMECVRPRARRRGVRGSLSGGRARASRALCTRLVWMREACSEIGAVGGWEPCEALERKSGLGQLGLGGGQGGCVARPSGRQPVRQGHA